MVESLSRLILVLLVGVSSVLEISVGLRFVLSSFDLERCRLELRRSCWEEDNFRRCDELSS